MIITIKVKNNEKGFTLRQWDTSTNNWTGSFPFDPRFAKSVWEILSIKLADGTRYGWVKGFTFETIKTE